MRGRYLMREYWSDSDLFLRLSAEEREIYIGLWMLADDGGWLPRNVPEIAGALMRFEDRGPREARTRTALKRLGALGKVSSFRCGCLCLPAVTKYPRSGKKSFEHQANHKSHRMDSNRFEDSIRTDSNGFEPLSRPDVTPPDLTSRASANGVNPEETEFRRLVPRPRAVS